MDTCKFKCLDCNWEGSNIEFDEVETCMGTDKTEMCPECGSINVIQVFKP